MAARFLSRSMRFKTCLMEGLDDIGLTLQKGTAIDEYEAKLASEPGVRKRKKP